MSEKKFANLHYPGMKSNPNEGQKIIDEQTLNFFKEQIADIGLDAQKKLLSTAVLVLAPSSLGILVAHKLMQLGIGRVGLFGLSTLTAAHGVSEETAKEWTSKYGDKAASKWILAKAKETFPWVEFETFSSTSIDRKIEDIVRGFEWIIAIEMSVDAEQAIKEAKNQKKNLVKVDTSSKDIEATASLAVKTIFNAVHASSKSNY